MADHEITDVEYEGKLTGQWQTPEVCAHCGETLGMHFQRADGRVFCVVYTKRETEATQHAPNPCQCPSGTCQPENNEGSRCWRSGFLVPKGYFGDRDEAKHGT